ncbi:hypothetical protein CLM85_32840 [Streptomyces albidoflavus]|uniref:WhiB family transcriptional regulator n=2 Tax=Streptomyces albidoflavus TaxID=1886 RepID=UPI000BB629C2|nr:WhiB family transcriptional regulator [Streptomyces albidoflavus]PBO20699.1 hypothetical protein CLM85_32840 [Streptomyces albidoflavus]
MTDSADPRFPAPTTSQATPCRANPQLFDCDPRDRDGESYGDMLKRIDRARALCASCPLATDCLRWALVNPTEITRVGIWAATAPYERHRLRARLAQRLGPNWVDVLATRLQDDKDRAARARQARHHPLTVEQARLLHLDRTHNGRRGRRHSAPGEQALHRAELLAALTNAA